MILLHWGRRGGARKRHQQEHRPQRPTESSDPTQHAKGRTGKCPGPRKVATTRRNVTQGVCNVGFSIHAGFLALSFHGLFWPKFREIAEGCAVAGFAAWAIFRLLFSRFVEIVYQSVSGQATFFSASLEKKTRTRTETENMKSSFFHQNFMISKVLAINF